MNGPRRFRWHRVLRVMMLPGFLLGLGASVAVRVVGV